MDVFFLILGDPQTSSREKFTGAKKSEDKEKSACSNRNRSNSHSEKEEEVQYRSYKNCKVADSNETSSEMLTEDIAASQRAAKRGKENNIQTRNSKTKFDKETVSNNKSATNPRGADDTKNYKVNIIHNDKIYLKDLDSQDRTNPGKNLKKNNTNSSFHKEKLPNCSKLDTNLKICNKKRTNENTSTSLHKTSHTFKDNYEEKMSESNDANYTLQNRKKQHNSSSSSKRSCTGTNKENSKISVSVQATSEVLKNNTRYNIRDTQGETVDHNDQRLFNSVHHEKLLANNLQEEHTYNESHIEDKRKRRSRLEQLVQHLIPQNSKILSPTVNLSHPSNNNKKTSVTVHRSLRYSQPRYVFLKRMNLLIIT